jgi:23S rRNA (guanine2445-N2)-methyltransferase / 23S rRNA (guanine2069-N7)-methyltransferase
VSTPLSLLASAPRGLADLLARELEGYGASDVRERSTGVVFTGSLETAYRACLWSRVANRVLLEIARFDAAEATQFYQAARAIDWSQHLGPEATLACDFSGTHPAITHTHFGALKLKDAICDSLRERLGARPDIARERPSVRVHAHARGAEITVSIDLSGESLHRRGYRGAAGEAPLKENVAAGVLLRAGWPELAQSGAPFFDPLCGSGTLVIEAALIASDIAPGLGREYFGFLGWRGHDAGLWQRVRSEALTRRSAQRPKSALRGCDKDPDAIRRAAGNALRAGVGEFTQFGIGALEDARAQADGPGLLCTNPPYGVRLEDHAAARAVHRELGRVLRERFPGWRAVVLSGAPDLGLELGIRARRTHVMWNGAIECRLLRLEVRAEDFRELDRPSGAVAPEASASPGARMFANRLGKNAKRLAGWARGAGISCYRLYDADMPEYALAIDRYRDAESAEDWLYVQEYAAPASIDPAAARRRRDEALSVLSETTGVSPERVRIRVRRRTTRGAQYQKLDAQAHFHTVEEGGLKFLVNFDDYLDTGLFLDHRLTRARLRAAASAVRFLNLFAYTGTATVYAAAGGAIASTSVDLSRTYLEWAARNLALNGFAGGAHALVQADVREWLGQAAQSRQRYELIFLDPPTFSNSKRMTGVLDVSRDHGSLIEKCAGLLAPGGLLVFSTNAQRFKLDAALAERYAIVDISRETVPRDYERNPRIHRCFEIRPRAAA